MIKVGIIGGTGYTGVELLRLLVARPEVELVAITSRSESGAVGCATFWRTPYALTWSLMCQWRPS